MWCACRALHVDSILAVWDRSPDGMAFICVKCCFGIDEYGATAGLITLEDLIEEIVGEIRDEYDTDEVDSITRLSDNEYMILGSTSIADVCVALDVSFESNDYDTIGGYCLELLNHVPTRNESIYTDEGIFIRIDRIAKNRIEKIYIKLPEQKN